MATYKLDFVSVGCNRVAGCTDWGHNKILAYSGGNFVVLYDVEGGRILNTLPGHTGRVNSVKWIPPVDIDFPKRVVAPETELLSAGSDGEIRVWSQQGSEWVSVEVLKGHTSSVTGLATYLTPEGILWVASCSSDNTVRVWKRDGKTWSAYQTLNCFNPWMAESVAFSYLPQNRLPIIAVGSVDTKIHLFCLNQETHFVRVAQVQGHEDWIRSLSFVSTDDRLMIASAGQDHRVRLWEIKQTTKQEPTSTSSLLKEIVEAGKTERGITELFEKHQQHHLFEIFSQEGTLTYSIMLETVLIGHEDWVTQVIWKPPTLIDDKINQEMCLLTISIDRTMIIWRPDVGPDGSGLWLDQVRVGEVGGNQQGFFGGAFGVNGKYISSHGANGGFHVWRKGEDESIWDPIITVSGHIGEVCDVAWDSQMNYFISTSYDQTTRLFSKWINNTFQKEPLWIEVARPQVHGYDLNCLTSINGRNHTFTSGAEEKMLRVFEGPKSFLTSLEHISEIKTVEGDDVKRALSANVPPLGLSNKPLYEGATEADLQGEGEMSSLYSKFDLDQTHHGHLPLVLEKPPLEEQLMQRTLWAEMHKLYGHPNEVKSVTCNHAGTLLASGCKASVKAVEAAIRIWCTDKWISKSTIQFHKSTVTQLEFSHSDKYLLSVSKSRTIAVMEIALKDDEVVVSMVDSCTGHNRMVNCCSWSHDGKFFVTGSRDLKAPNAKVWTIEEGKIKSITSMLFKAPVTAVAFCPIPIEEGYVAAFGLQDGSIALWQAKEVEGKLQWKEYLKIQTTHAHVAAVKRLRWNAKISGKTLHLLSCSKDFSVRLFAITI